MKPYLVFFLLTLNCYSASSQNDDTNKIRAINSKYVSFWLKNDETGVLSLFSNEATLAPSGLNPIKGINEIKSFWFPQDGSVTTILKFTNEIQCITFHDNIAQSTQLDHLEWSYAKESVKIKREQWGIATTLYQKQSDGKWKIIHQMWKDYKVIDK